MENIKENSVVQINENGQEGWVGCLVQVDEVKSWGIQGWVQIPMGGRAFIRVNNGEFDVIGQATLVPQE